MKIKNLDHGENCIDALIDFMKELNEDLVPLGGRMIRVSKRVDEFICAFYNRNWEEGVFITTANRKGKEKLETSLGSNIFGLTISEVGGDDDIVFLGRKE